MGEECVLEVGGVSRERGGWAGGGRPRQRGERGVNRDEEKRKNVGVSMEENKRKRQRQKEKEEQRRRALCY